MNISTVVVFFCFITYCTKVISKNQTPVISSYLSSYIYWMYKDDFQKAYSKGIHEGIQKGIQEGIQKGKLKGEFEGELDGTSTMYEYRCRVKTREYLEFYELRIMNQTSKCLYVEGDEFEREFKHYNQDYVKHLERIFQERKMFEQISNHYAKRRKIHIYIKKMMSWRWRQWTFYLDYISKIPVSSISHVGLILLHELVTNRTMPWEGCPIRMAYLIDQIYERFNEFHYQFSNEILENYKLEDCLWDLEYKWISFNEKKLTKFSLCFLSIVESVEEETYM